MSRKPTELLLAAMQDKRVLAIDGPNFSGRSDLLRRFCRVISDGRMYLGPEVYFALSGLTTSVRQELELHAGGTLESCDCLESAEQLKLTKLFEQHPATLSGGEQTCLAVLCAIILKPKILAVDCALEQLDSHKLRTALDMLQGPTGPTGGSVITDNRLDEWNVAIQTVAIAGLSPDPSGRPAIAPLDPSKIDRLDPVSAPVIELRDVTAAYGRGSDVLRGVSLTLQPGCVYTLQGPNGCGKSTLAKILSGVLRPVAGQIFVNNAASNLSKTPGRIAGYHLQNPDVGLFEASVRAELGFKSGSINASAVTAVRDAFGLQDFAASNPLALPFPVRKRVSLAATIARLPPWIILDEPTLGADAATIVALTQIIQSLSRKQHGVIVISHSRKLLEMLRGNELKIENGQVFAAN
ncbi:MAG: ATP-binding cassette domain-containing protein [Tepidisphaeraceae bacterium]|jgi:energy-coupling factor transport system ATP-binding protein